MIRLLPLLAAAALAACAHVHDHVPGPNEANFDLGSVHVVERNDAGDGGYYMDSTIVFVADARRKKEIGDLLKAAMPKEFGGPTGVNGLAYVASLDAPRVMTIEDHIADLKLGDKLNREAWAKGHPSEPYYVSEPLDYEAIRRDLAAALKGHDALVQRHVHVKRPNEK